MSKYRKDSISQKKENNFSTKMIVGAGVLILMILIAFIIMKPEPINSADFCPDSGPKGTTALLIDLSDPLSPSQEQKLINELNYLTETSEARQSSYLEKHAKLTTYFTNDTEIPTNIFSYCNPGSNSQLSSFDKMNEHKILYLKKWNKFSSETMEKIKLNIKGDQSTNTSPIIESLAFIREREFAPSDIVRKDKNSNKIIIVSDLIQNSKLYNQYKQDIDTKLIFDKKPISLHGIEIYIFFITSEKYKNIQTDQFKLWWRKYFNKGISGAEDGRWTTL